MGLQQSPPIKTLQSRKETRTVITQNNDRTLKKRWTESMVDTANPSWHHSAVCHTWQGKTWVSSPSQAVLWSQDDEVTQHDTKTSTSQATPQEQIITDSAANGSCPPPLRLLAAPHNLLKAHLQIEWTNLGSAMKCTITSNGIAQYYVLMILKPRQLSHYLCFQFSGSSYSRMHAKNGFPHLIESKAK